MSKKPARPEPAHTLRRVFSYTPDPQTNNRTCCPRSGTLLTGRCQPLLNLAQKIQAAKTKPPRHIDVWVDALDDDDREALLQAAADPDLTNAALQRIVREAGCKVGKDVFNEWRKAHGFPR